MQPAAWQVGDLGSADRALVRFALVHQHPTWGTAQAFPNGRGWFAAGVGGPNYQSPPVCQR
jgi:hypothetical protein